jgi:dihydrofolate reductase
VPYTYDTPLEFGVIGSVDFVQTLIAEGLFDRLSLWIYPILVGAGKRVFAGGAVPSNLTLLERAFTSPMGVVFAHYALAGGTPSTGDMTRPDRGSSTPDSDSK